MKPDLRCRPASAEKTVMPVSFSVAETRRGSVIPIVPHRCGATRLIPIHSKTKPQGCRRQRLAERPVARRLSTAQANAKTKDELTMRHMLASHVLSSPAPMGGLRERGQM